MSITATTSSRAMRIARSSTSRRATSSREGARSVKSAPPAARPARIFGSRNERLLKQYSHDVAAINALEPQIARLTDTALAAKTDELRKRASDGATLDELLPEAFAIVREASKRTLRMRHFDVQLLGGMVLNNGKIGEMK